MENNNPGEDTSTLLADMNPNSVDNIGAKLFEETFGETIDGIENPSEEVTTEVETDDQFENVVDEIQTDKPVDDHLDVVEDSDDIEADEAPEQEVNDQQEDDAIVDVSDMEIVEYDELKNHLLEFHGEHYTAAQISSMLGQAKSAGAKAREASDALKDIEAQKTELDQARAQLNTRKDASVASDDMYKMQAEGREIGAKIEKARAEGDMYEVTVQKDQLELLGRKFQEAKQQVEEQGYQQEQEMQLKAEAGLKDLGLGYLLQKGPAADAWTSYANDHLSAQDSYTVSMNPELTEMVEKARKWDNANSKAKAKKLKTSGKTLGAGSGKPVSSQTSKRVSESNARMKAGEGTQADVDAAALSFANSFFDN